MRGETLGTALRTGREEKPHRLQGPGTAPDQGLFQGPAAAQLQLPGMDSERGVVKRIENGSRFVADLKLCLPADDFRVSVSARLRRE